MLNTFDAWCRDRSPKARRPRRGLASLETLEIRNLMAYTPLGASLPDLVVTGSVPPVAAYGGTITVQVDVSNIGHSSMVEPIALAPGAVSSADAGPSQVGVYLTTNPHRLTRRAVRIGSVDVPEIRQNSTVNIYETLAMPAEQPRGLPANGRDVFVFFRVNDTRTVLEIDRSNNTSRGSQPVRLAAPLPELSAEAIDLPQVLNPGDVIAPSYQIANLGTVDTADQAPVTVQLVASTDEFFGPTDVILATYTIPNIPPLSRSPARGRTVLGNVTLDTPPNVRTIGGQAVALPADPGQYFIGVIVDPLQQIRQIRDLEGPRVPILQELRVVGSPIHGLAPANTALTPPPASNIFPTPAYGLITSPFFPPSQLGVGVVTTATVSSTVNIPARTPTRGAAFAGRALNRPGRGALIGLPSRGAGSIG